MSHKLFASNLMKVAAPVSLSEKGKTSSEKVADVDLPPDIGESSESVCSLERTPSDPDVIPLFGSILSEKIQRECNSALNEIEELEFGLLQNAYGTFVQDYETARTRQLARAQEAALCHHLETEIERRSRSIAPTYFGWEAHNWGERSGASLLGSDTVEGLWRTLRRAEAHEIPLEDPAVSTTLFDRLQEALGVEEIGRPADVSFEMANPMFEHSRRRSDPQARYRRNAHARQRSPRPLENNVFVHDLEGDELDATLFSPSNASPYLTPSHHRARSANFVGITRQRTVRSAPRSRLQTTEVRPQRGKSTAQRRMEQELAKREADLRLTLKHQFRANPVPASSLSPRGFLKIWKRYAEVMRKMGNRSAEARAERITTLQANCKPFSFHERAKSGEVRACRCRTKIAGVIEDALVSLKKEREEHFERSRHKNFGQSRLVLDAAESGRRRRQMIEENEKRTGLTDEHKFRPKINFIVPPFHELHEDFQRQLETKKTLKPTTQYVEYECNWRAIKCIARPKPFAGIELHHRNRDESTHRKLTVEGQKEQEAIAHRNLNKSLIARVHAQQTKNQMKAWKAKEEEEIETSFEARVRAKQLSLKIQARMRFDMNSRIHECADKARNYKIIQSRNEADYKLKLDKMKERLESRPCLFERETLRNRKVALQKEDARQTIERIAQAYGLQNELKD
ncbi:hypothetical protein BJ742DRAFT_735224 [Cladochytrium replicatum]|nr:hypothetical protein BJ742DRAFT_735224 [Cladochytrium replicatum]